MKLWLNVKESAEHAGVSRDTYRRCRLANATPEPDFR